MKKIKILLTALCFLAFSFNSFAYDLVVAKDGSGNYTTVQAAINAAPTGLVAPYTIFIKNGKYFEKITVPSNKPFIHLIGESVANVILTYNDGASNPIAPCSGSTVGTQNSASFTVNATDCAFFNITFENSYGDGTQAVAVLVNNDKAVFKNCRFLGNQDTLYVKGSGQPRHYFRNCYIDGNVDFIFGSSIDVFDSCVIVAKSRTSAGASYITAANTTQGIGQKYGFVFRDCRLLANTGATVYYLGRPWQNSSSGVTAYNRTVFINPVYGNGLIQPTGWSTWDAGTNTSNLLYAEFMARNENGTAHDISSRAAWSTQLNQAGVDTFTNALMFGTWDPCAVSADVCTYSPAPIAISNFKVTKGASNTTIKWNTSWPLQGIQMDLYRSSTFGSGYTLLNTQTTADTNNINYSYTDASLPPAGIAYYYYITASKAGLASHTTDTLSSSNLPALSASAVTFCGISQSLGTPSASSAFTLTGTNLTNDATIIVPTPYEFSVDGTTWVTASNTLTIPQVAGSINQLVYLRLNATVTGTYNATTNVTSIAANTIALNMYGTCNGPVLASLLQKWPLTANNQDDAASRATGIMPSSPTLNKLYLSLGTGSLAAYSTTNGQAVGASATVDGAWGTANGGPGGNLNRNYYEQFTITAASGYTLKVDSINLTTAFYNTASGLKLAILYSKTGFVSDSAEVTGVSGPAGFTGLGTFANPVVLGNQTGGVTNNYRFALNGTLGVNLPAQPSLPAGQPLTIRLYYVTSSTGNPRYNLLKDVELKGTVSSVVPVTLISFTGKNDGKSILLNWKTENEVNVDKYEVQRSADGVNFETISTTIAKNASANSYTQLDANPLIAATAYYRLKITDKDGTIKYSHIISFKKSLAGLIKISPNPASDFINIEMPIKAKYEIALYDIAGKKITSITTFNKIVQIPVKQYSKGYYAISINNGDEKVVTKIVIN